MVSLFVTHSFIRDGEKGKGGPSCNNQDVGRV